MSKGYLASQADNTSLFSFYKKHIKQMPLSCSTNPQHNQKAAHPDAVVLVDPDVVEGRFLSSGDKSDKESVDHRVDSLGGTFRPIPL